jgi:hypothetical protein
MKTKDIFNEILTEISKDDRVSELLTDEGKKELEKIVKDINNIAIDIVEDYANIPSEESGSVVLVHQNSPLLDDENIELSESISIGIHHTKEEKK